jgi:hypothetical protein
VVGVFVTLAAIVCVGEDRDSPGEGMGDGTEFDIKAGIFVGVESGVVVALFIEAEQAARATARSIKAATR